MGGMIINFWCETCHEDHKILGQKKYLNSVFGIVWEAKCPSCERPMRRLINNAKSDWYYRLSRQVRYEFKKFALDIIQVDDPRFDIFYPQHKKKREEDAGKIEISNWNKHNKIL